MIIKKIDKKNKFVSMFNTETGFYVRTGVLEDGKDTGVDPFMTSYPELIDVGVMGHCVHGASGLCMKAGIQCYQNGLKTQQPNMTLENFKRIVDECKGKTYQLALGGRGDVDQHENFEEIVKYCRENNIVPNFTSSGLGFNDDIIRICKQYCGAVAISAYSRLDTTPIYVSRELEASEVGEKTEGTDYSVYFTLGGTNADCVRVDDTTYMINGKEYKVQNEPISDTQHYDTVCVYNEVNNANNYTCNAIKNLLKAEVKTNIHFVLSNQTIEEAIKRLKYNGFPKGINAVIFLLHKPVGLGDQKNVLNITDERVQLFFELVNKSHNSFKIGFDSCTVPAIVNLTDNIVEESIDTCEGGRWSAYITSDMKMLPCSFDNQELKWAYDISNDTIQNAWDSEQFEDFRSHFKNSCKGCVNRNACMGGCPIRREIVLCNKPEKDLFVSEVASGESKV